MKNEKKKSLGTVVISAFLFAAFVAAIRQAVVSVAHTASVNPDPFWWFFGGIIWGAVIGTLLIVMCLVWKEEI
jgi:phosphotransferase system  glucose/maltose/N-acetylglucosamine-specific IIC component